MRNQKESGQVIILMVFGIISLLGFSALAIDGARLFSEKRNSKGCPILLPSLPRLMSPNTTPIQFIPIGTRAQKIEPHAEQAALRNYPQKWVYRPGLQPFWRERFADDLHRSDYC